MVLVRIWPDSWWNPVDLESLSYMLAWACFPQLWLCLNSSRVVKTSFAEFGEYIVYGGIWYLGLWIALFKSLGSMQILIFPGFDKMTVLLIHSVGSVIFWMMPFFSSSSYWYPPGCVPHWDTIWVDNKGAGLSYVTKAFEHIFVVS